MLHSIKIIVHSKSLSWFRLTLFPLGSPGNSSWPASVVDWIWKMLVDDISTVDPNCTDNRQKKEQQIEGAVTTEKRWRIGRGTQRLFSVKYPGAPKEKFWEKDLKTTQSMEKAFWSHFKHFGRLLGKKSICSSLTARPMGDGCGYRAKFSPSLGGGGELGVA